MNKLLVLSTAIVVLVLLYVFYSTGDKTSTVKIVETTEPNAFLQIEKSAEGKSIKNAKQTADPILPAKIIYNAIFLLKKYFQVILIVMNRIMMIFYIFSFNLSL